ncbi:MAG: WD40/YVTN/BNR-like repeat-containing protein [Vicinamibacteria bacterium]
MIASALLLAALVQGLEYRLVGPFRGGRVVAVAGIADDRRTFYMGSTGGGVWKSGNGGESWENVSDGYFRSASVGAIEIAASDPNVIYVGMGEACLRGNVSPGDGVYKSEDAGRSWKHLGLSEAGQIGKIRVHPKDPDLVYVAVLGHAFGPNPERGVFRSTDGGGTWEKVLFVSERAGAVDLAMDERNPRVLYAAIWEAVRKPWTLVSGGADSGIYRSRDGGESWTLLTEGLPAGVKGRIGLAVSPAHPERVWAVVEAKDGGLFRSDDGGTSFRFVNGDRRLLARPFYYMHLVPHPTDENTLFAPAHADWLLKSTDGGKSFETLSPPHGDNHALWIHPRDPEIMVLGDDGGAAVTYDGGRSWSTQSNQPTAEIYRVATDDQFLYRLYGAQQDNTTISIASRTTGGGITERDWYPRRRRRAGPHRAASEGSQHRLRRVLRGNPRALRPSHRSNQEHPRLPAVRRRGPGQGPEVPIPDERPPPRVPARASRSVPHLSRGPPVDRRGPELDHREPRPHPGR